MTATWSVRRTRLALAALLVGTMLAPLNSSMIAVALAPIQQHLDLPLATTTWIVTVFYLTACVFQPVLGRVADLIGTRGLFTAGMMIASAASAAAPFATSAELLVLCRCAQAIGVSAAFPCAVVVTRRHGHPGQLTTIAIVNTTAGAVGPVLGGLLTALAGWQAIFWANLPLAIGAAVVALVVLEPRARSADATRPLVSRSIDPVGTGLFAVSIVALLNVMLALPRISVIGGLVLVVAVPAFLWWERRAANPFVDIRAVYGARGLTAVLGIFTLFNLAYYSAFYGLPQWLQTERHTSALDTGLLVLPIAVTSVVATVCGGALMRWLGAGRALLAGSGMFLAGVTLIVAFGPSTPTWLVVADGVLLGIPYGLCNLGLQRLMYERTPSAMAGVVGGLFQSARYVGAILAVGLIGALAPMGPAEPVDIAVIAIAMTAVAVGVVALLTMDMVRNRSGGDWRDSAPDGVASGRGRLVTHRTRLPGRHHG
ncbi:MFS transporter [Saccharopolyspora pogona]|uniref:MFS transporter n=1 Tax=Saccharopolyspora pogona TaxID=333966 RepID=UPI001682772E|nr:MFS transporter [Saccharopolyspora pogona]